MLAQKQSIQPGSGIWLIQNMVYDHDKAGDDDAGNDTEKDGNDADDDDDDDGNDDDDDDCDRQTPSPGLVWRS